MVRANNSFSALVLGALVLSIVLLPISFDFFKYVIAGLFLLISISVVVTYTHKASIPYSPAYLSIGVFTLIYFVWALIAVHNNNRLEYIFKDSAGFLVYWVYPILFVYVAKNNLFRQFVRALVLCAIIVALINLAAFVAFYSQFETLTFENLTATNAFLRSLGLNWELGASSGVLRGNTKAGHYMLLGMALLFFMFMRTPRMIFAILIGFLFVGTLLDGHRALVLSAVIFFIMVSPLTFRIFNLYPNKSLIGAFLIGSLLVAPFLLYIELERWFGRFEMLQSIQLRGHQVPALMDEIGEHPFLGNGFGSSAAVIRNEGRPFMYEVDFLAVAMKLGVIGGLVYFATYIATIGMAFAKRRTIYGYVMLSLGIAYFFYMGTNGGFAMSPISSFFHVLLFLCVSFGVMRESEENLGVGRYFVRGKEP